MPSLVPRGKGGGRGLIALVASSCLCRAASLHIVPPDGDANATLGGVALSDYGNYSQCKCGHTAPRVAAHNATQHRAPRRPKRKNTIMVTVSVNESGKLRASLRCNRPLMERIIVVTSEGDNKTQRLCEEEKVQCFVTELMYKNGDAFNKGRALSQVQRRLLRSPANHGSFLLFVDADVCLPSTTWSELPGEPQPGVLYSTASRCFFDTPEHYTAGTHAVQRQLSSQTMGLFQAYRLDPGTPLYPDTFPTASGSDLAFGKAFPQKAKLGLWVAHLGNAPQRDWSGFRGDADRWEAAAPPPEGACPCCEFSTAPPRGHLHHSR